MNGRVKVSIDFVPMHFAFANNYSIALRVEWCKARARAHRWQEECLLLDEEMRRVKMFLGWQIEIWNDRASQTFPTLNNTHSPENANLPLGIREQELAEEGRRAYAYRQAAICRRIQHHCEVKWAGLSESLRAGEGAAIDGVFIECHEVVS